MAWQGMQAADRKRAERVIVPLIFLVGLLTTSVFFSLYIMNSGYPWHWWGWACGSALFGMSVGFSEILSRYRDEPILACTTNGGVSYLLLNGALSLAAFWLLCRYPSIFPSLKGDLFLTSVAGGFGAVTVFRAKLFTFRASDGKDYPIGPAIVLETVLKTLDQKIDRKRATDRQARVFQLIQGLNDFENTAKYFQASLNSFQNLTPQEKADINSVIDEYRSQKTATWPDGLKIMALGFAFLDIAGNENFDKVIENLKQFLTPKPPAPANPPNPNQP